MARYWQAKTLYGFYVEGVHQDRTIAEKLLETFNGVKMSDEILGAGFYVWLQKGADPALRVKDLSDRTIIEVLLPDTPVKSKPAAPAEDEEETAATAVEETPFPAPDTEAAGSETVETGDEETEEEALPTPHPESPMARMLAELEAALGNMFERVSECPAELQTSVDLKLRKWQTPKPMAITRGEPIGGLEGIDLDTTVGRTGGGLTGILIIAVVVIALGIGTWAILNSAANEPYYVYQPGTQFERTEEAIGFIQQGTDELIVIQVPSRLDTIWGSNPRFIRAEEDTIPANLFVAEEIDELRVEQVFGPCVILTPDQQAEESTASVLDIASLVWNQSEDWEEWFAMEINRALISGTLVRLDDQLHLQVDQNYVGLTISPYLSEPEQIMLDFAEMREIEVVLEVQFEETYRYNQERTSARRRLFLAEISRVMLP